MKEFFKTSSFRVLMIAIVVLLGFLIYTATAGSSFLANVLGFVSSPMQSISTEVVGAVRNFTDLDGMSKDELKQMIQALEQENAQLTDKLVDYESLKQENAQLKVQLEISEVKPENEMRSASVIGRDPNDVFFGFSIDKGTLGGIRIGDPVITQKGLVGVVTQAYATSSKVTCLLSEDMHVAAVCREKKESGVITSDIMTASSGLLRMNYLSGETQLAPGDVITTSGAGGDYPEGLKIGVVQSVEKSENDISRYAVVKPYEDLTGVKDVFAIVSFPGKNEVQEPVETQPGVSGGEDME